MAPFLTKNATFIGIASKIVATQASCEGHLRARLFVVVRAMAIVTSMAPDSIPPLEVISNKL